MITATTRWTLSILFWIAFALVFTGVFKRNKGSARLLPNGEVDFVPRWWFVCSWVFITVRLGFIGSGYLRAGLNEPLRFATGVLICIALVGSLSAIPGPIKAKTETLEEVRWFWWNKKIRWTEIEEIDCEERSSTITVIGYANRKINYSNLYPDRARFLLAIRQHCANDLPANFPDNQ
jgi:hypothetical protein